MLELDGLVTIAILALWIYCLVDVITTDESVMRNLSKPMWVVIVLLFSLVGSIIWLVAGRPQRGASTGPPYKGNRGDAYAPVPLRSRPAPLAPDDDPEFLARVKADTTEDKKLLASWEDDLRRREEELRKREGDPPATS